MSEVTQQLRVKLLESSAQVIDEVIARGTGKPRDHRIEDKDLNRVWDAVVPILQQVGDHRKIEASSCADVIKALSAGKVSVDEALKLMTMLRTQAESEVLPALEAKLAAMEK